MNLTNFFTNEQIAVMNTPSAMKIIQYEAKSFIAKKFKVEIEFVDIAIHNKNENDLKMYADLISTGIIETAKLVDFTK